MRTAKKEAAAPAPAVSAEKRDTGKGDAIRASLRGKEFAEQEQALKPGAKDGPKGGAGELEKPVGPQPAPHSIKGLGKGKFHLFVEGQNAHFHQRVRVEGARAALPGESTPAIGEPIEIDAKGPWSVVVESKVPEGTTWAKDRPKGWSASTHKQVSRGPDHLDVSTEDFKDNDFDDLVLSVIRLPEGGSVKEGGDGAYLVESETKIEGYQTSYDLVLGASESGRLDVMLNYQIITPDELARVDKDALAAMSERFASLKSSVASSVEHAEKRKQIEAEIGAWERALQEARAKAVAAPAPEAAKSAAPKV